MPTSGDSEFLLFLQQDPFGKSCLESDTEASGNEYNSDASSNFEEEEAFQDAGPGEATATGTGGGLTLVVGDGLLAMGDDGLDLSQECLSPGQAHTARRLSDLSQECLSPGQAHVARRLSELRWVEEPEVSHENPSESLDTGLIAPSESPIVNSTAGRDSEKQVENISVQQSSSHEQNILTAILHSNIAGQKWLLAQELGGDTVWVKEVMNNGQAAQTPQSTPWHMPREGDCVVKVNGAGFESKNPKQLVSYIEQEKNSRGCVDVTLERAGESGSLLFIVRLNRPMLESAREHLGLEIRTRDQVAFSEPKTDLAGTTLVMNKKMHEMSVKMLGPVSGSDQGRSNPFPSSPLSSVKALPGSSTEGWQPRLSGTYPVGRGGDSAPGSSEAGAGFLTPKRLGAHDRLSNSVGSSPASSLYSTLERVTGADHLASPSSAHTRSPKLLSPRRGERVDDLLSPSSVRHSPAPSSRSSTTSSRRPESGPASGQLSSRVSAQLRSSDLDVSEIMRMAVEDVEFCRRRAAEAGGGQGFETGEPEDLDSSVMSEQEHQVAIETAREKMYHETRALYVAEVETAIRRQSVQQTTPFLQQLAGAQDPAPSSSPVVYAATLIPPSEVLYGSPARPHASSTSPSRSPPSQSLESARVETLIT